MLPKLTTPLMSMMLLGAGSSGGGVAAPGVPGVPTSFGVTARTETTLQLTRDADAAGVTARVQWQVAGGDWSELLGNAAAVAQYFEVSGLSGDTSYDVRIRAENAGGDSAWVTLTAEWTLPAAPTGLSAATGGYEQVNLTFDGATNGRTINVYANGSLYVTGITSGEYTYDDSSPGNTTAFTISATGGTSGLEGAQSGSVNGTSGVGSGPINLTTPYLDSFGNLQTAGTWSGDPSSISLSYQWYLNGSPGSLPGNSGDEVYVVETATNAVGSNTAQSNTITVP